MFKTKTQTTSTIVAIPAIRKADWRKFDSMMDKRVKANKALLTTKKPNWTKFEKSMQTWVRLQKAQLAFSSTDPAVTWGVNEHHESVRNDALKEAEENIKILDNLCNQEWDRGNKVAARLHHEQALAWFKWAEKVYSATPAEFFAYHWSYELGL